MYCMEEIKDTGEHSRGAPLHTCFSLCVGQLSRLSWCGRVVGFLLAIWADRAVGGFGVFTIVARAG